MAPDVIALYKDNSKLGSRFQSRTGRRVASVSTEWGGEEHPYYSSCVSGWGNNVRFEAGVGSLSKTWPQNIKRGLVAKAVEMYLPSTGMVADSKPRTYSKQ